MKKFLFSLCVACLAFLPLAAQDYTVAPSQDEVTQEGLSYIELTWPEGTVVDVVDPGKVWFMDPEWNNIWGGKGILYVENPKVTPWDPQSPLIKNKVRLFFMDPDGFTDMEGRIINKWQDEAFVMYGINAGALKINGVSNENIDGSYYLPADEAAVTFPRLSYEPPQNPELLNELSKITLWWNGVTVEEFKYAGKSWPDGWTHVYVQFTSPDRSFTDVVPTSSIRVENGKIVIEFPKPYTEAGRYDVSVYPGLFLCTKDGKTVDNPSLFLGYKVGSYSTFPAGVGTDPITGAFDGIEIYSANITVANPENKPSFLVSYDLRGDNNADEIGSPVFGSYELIPRGVKVKYAEPWLPNVASAFITVTVPANTFYFDGTLYDKDITVDYVQKGAVPKAYATPGPDTKVGALTGIYVDWANCTVDLGSRTQGSLMLQLPDGSEVDVTKNLQFRTVYSDVVDGDIVSLSLYLDFTDAPYTQAGTYTLKMPENFVKIAVYNQGCQAQEFSFTVEPTDVNPVYTSSPAEGKIDEVGEFEITFTNDKFASLDPYAKITIYKDGKDMNSIVDPDSGIKVYSIGYSMNGSTLKVYPQIYYTADDNDPEGSRFIPTVVTDEGEYEVRIPAGALQFMVGDVLVTYAKPIVLKYKVGGVDTFPLPIETIPAQGSTIGYMGNIDFVWYDVEFDVTKEYGRQYALDKSKLHVYVDGVENTAWKRWSGVSFIAMKTQESNEQLGGQELFDSHLIRLNLGMQAIINLHGEIGIVIDEGVVSSTDGSVSPRIELTFYSYEPMDWSTNVIWNPEIPVFAPGKAVFSAEWEGHEVVALDENTPPFYEAYNADGDRTGRLSAWEYVSLEDGKLVFDFSSMEEGTYNLIVPEGSVTLMKGGKGYINVDAFYNFRIEQPELQPSHLSFGSVEDQEGVIQDKNGYDGHIAIRTSDDAEYGMVTVTVPSSSHRTKYRITSQLQAEEDWQVAADNVVRIPVGEGTIEIYAEHSSTLNTTNTLKFTYEVGNSVSLGVGMVGAEGIYRVYNLNGVNVLNTTDKAELDRLPRGIYIVNGKKFVK